MEYLTPKELAEKLKVTEKLLSYYRQRGKGPPFFSLQPRGRILYDAADVKNWINTRKQHANVR